MCQLLLEEGAHSLAFITALTTAAYWAAASIALTNLFNPLYSVEKGVFRCLDLSVARLGWRLRLIRGFT